LSEEGLIILLDETGHREAKNNEKGADCEERVVVPCIEEGAGESANE
jgi:hypothetical protein